MRLLAVLLFLSLSGLQTAARQGGQPPSAKAAPAPAQTTLLVRTTTRRELRQLGYGGQLTVLGAPEGSVTIEAWPRAEVEIIADIELRAPTEEDLTLLASVNGFLLEENLNHLRLVTSGTHDRRYMKRAARDFPKRLLSMPWKIDYRVRMPPAVDLEIYAGRGAVSVAGIEGAIRLNAGDASPATLTLAGGDVEATVARGALNLRVAARSWRGRGANVRLVSGDLTVELPADFNGDIDAEVLRTGRVVNTYVPLAPRDNSTPNERSLRARAGAGGATLSFIVGDGTLSIKPAGVKK